MFAGFCIMFVSTLSEYMKFISNVVFNINLTSEYLYGKRGEYATYL